MRLSFFTDRNKHYSLFSCPEVRSMPSVSDHKLLFWILPKNLINDLFNVFLAIFKLAFISFQIYGNQLLQNWTKTY